MHSGHANMSISVDISVQSWSTNLLFLASAEPAMTTRRRRQDGPVRTPEAILHQIAKREAAINQVKEDFPIPEHIDDWSPDPHDRMISKRTWEFSMQTWRYWRRRIWLMHMAPEGIVV